VRASNIKMSFFHVKIKAQVEWDTYLDADSAEAAGERAKEEFELAAPSIAANVVTINSVEVEARPEGDLD